MKSEKKKQDGVFLRRILLGMITGIWSVIFLAGLGTFSVLYAGNAAELSAETVSLPAQADTAQKQAGGTADAEAYAEGKIEILSGEQSAGTGDSVPLMGMLFLAFCSLFLGVMEIFRKIRF